MTELLTGLTEARQRLLVRADQLSSIWQHVQSATGSEGAGTGLIAADLDRIRADLEHHTFTVAIFGLIKRGKSTLLNALLGEEVSPTHITPETAVPVYVDHGEHASATVHLARRGTLEVDRDELGQWVSQKHNPRNERGVSHVRWTLPSPLLRNGVRLVDTPGLDDADADDLYTRRTIQELDAADVGIVVFLSPPTVGATEMAFLRDVASAHLRKTLLVANMYPQQFHDPDSRAEVVAYVRDQIVDQTDATDVQVHPVCAEEAWQARCDGDTDTWEAAGGAALLRGLEETVEANTGRRALAQAEAALDRASEVVSAAIELRMEALTGDLDPEDHERLQLQRKQVAARGEDQLERRLSDIVGVRAMLDALINELFMRTRAAIRAAGSVAELERLLARFTRELEVVTEDAFRKLHARLMSIHDENTRDLDAGAAVTLHDVGAQLTIRYEPDDAEDPEGDGPEPAPGVSAVIGRPVVQGAAVGGVLGGGAGVALVGAVLGPVGIVAGALVGWGLGTIVRNNRELRPLREEVDERLGEIADEVLAEFDRRVDDLVAAIRASARHRRLGLEADLTDLLDLLERLPPDSAERTEAIGTLQSIAAFHELMEDINTFELAPLEMSVTDEAAEVTPVP
jgi:hypothetical protein